ncbi:hypothetical protein FMZ60_09045 [Alcaligenaceae bacterium SJ-26]|nr:hypothetical protein FMZ60_09045 [Alcaligenaceae bacterium SJ-26]
MEFIPILRWKRGEQNALSSLNHTQKSATTPLISINNLNYSPPDNSNFDGLFDNRIIQDAERLSNIWSRNRVLVDLNDISPYATCENNEHPISLFFRNLSRDVDARPVLRATSDQFFAEAVADLGIPPVFRITPEDFSDHNIEDDLSWLLEICSFEPRECAVIIDLGYVQSVNRSVLTAVGALSSLPFLNSWGSITLASGSFPENLSNYPVGPHLINRIEWDIWQAVSSTLRIRLGYGDYATIHPNPAEEGLDPRTMNPSASVRYTYDNSWLLLRGEGTRNRNGRGFAQFQDHAINLVRMPQYRGENFSFGDQKIARIARGEESQGNLETWVTIGINHHIAEIVDRLSNLP